MSKDTQDQPSIQKSEMPCNNCSPKIDSTPEVCERRTFTKSTERFMIAVAIKFLVIIFILYYQLWTQRQLVDILAIELRGIKYGADLVLKDLDL